MIQLKDGEKERGVWKELRSNKERSRGKADDGVSVVDDMEACRHGCTP